MNQEFFLKSEPKNSKCNQPPVKLGFCRRGKKSIDCVVCWFVYIITSLIEAELTPSALFTTNQAWRIWVTSAGAAAETCSSTRSYLLYWWSGGRHLVSWACWRGHGDGGRGRRRRRAVAHRCCRLGFVWEEKIKNEKQQKLRLQMEAKNNSNAPAHKRRTCFSLWFWVFILLFLAGAARLVLLPLLFLIHLLRL